MTTAQALSMAASVVSIIIAGFAVWLSLQQRAESQRNYDQTKDVLSDIESVMEKTEQLVSENFQELLQSTVERQRELMKHLEPTEKKYADLLAHLAKEDPDKLDQLVDAIIKIQDAQVQQSGGGQLAQLLQLAQEQQQSQGQGGL